ncbi:Eukaryotic translation initiation factor 4 gamma 1 [Heterocephalus glaber]|uniref:Eukaryotic translation initiation factor 4 gamma 1 n=1 Tax=Heterocephalus glaber TaxID=10181 RepID=G5AW22_HETGA|nr:Eukaryotic translation initiation factor 4 gamma 1 [Heterocephalus glaber]
MPTGMIQKSVEESTPISHETEEPYCLSPEPTPLAKPILEVEVTLSKPIPESEFSSSALQIPAPLESHKVEVPEANSIVPSEELGPEVESSPEVAPVLPVVMGDLLDAFKEANPVVPEAENQPPIDNNPGPESEGTGVAPRPEEAEETWDSKEDKIQNAENIQPGEQKYDYKSDQWKPLNLEEKKRYDREFLLGFQFIFANAFKEANPVVPEAENQPPIDNNPGPESEGTGVAPRPEEAEETWDSKEDKIQNAENIQPGEQKYDYKSDQWKPLNLEEKKRYDREFLLGFQFIFASLQKPEGLPHITDVVLDKANKTPLWTLDPSRLLGINCGPDFTPSFANLGRPALSIHGPPRGGPVSPLKAALSEEELEKKSKAIIEEYLHLNDMKEALQCVQELGSPSLLFIFVWHGVESTLERSTIAREHMGKLLHRLLCAGHLSTVQYYQGLYEILELVEDMEIDISHVWLYLAELVTPILQEGGLPMGELFREITKPLRKVEYTLGEESDAPGQRAVPLEELSKQLEKLLQEGNSNQRVLDWIEANLSGQQTASNTLVHALMTAVCYSAVIFETPLRVDVVVLKARARLLQKYLCDEQKELQALYALQALVVTLEQPPNLLRMFFNALYDEDMVKEEAFYSWKSSKDPAEQLGKGMALKSVTAFFNWLREAEEEESDHN